MPKSIALLVGIADYKNTTKLTNPANDARDLSAALDACGFVTTVCTDVSIADLDDAFNSFVEQIEEGDVALFFFAGHGVQIDGSNYLLALDTPTSSPSAAKYASLPLDRVIEDMTDKNGATTLIVLDACRNNPWAEHRRGGGRGLAPVYAPKGTLLAFSTSPGEVASDGIGGSNNGAYTSSLLSHIRTSDLPIEQMFKRVRNTLSVVTGGVQTSWEHTSLSGEFYFELGVTRRISEYGPIALKDSAFVPDPNVWPHQIISGLKSYSWYTQNPALSGFNAMSANGASNDDLFVLGRNILQAAEGSSTSAVNFINNFVAATAGVQVEKKKSILDGILFEIFFDSNGEIRREFKNSYFNEVFNLQRIGELSHSFEFISSALQPFLNRFYVAPPGRGHQVAIDILLLDDPVNAVDQIVLAGNNILRAQDDDYLNADRMYRSIVRGRFEDRISRQLMVPLRDLTITYGNRAVPESLNYPWGFTAARLFQ